MWVTPQGLHLEAWELGFHTPAPGGLKPRATQRKIPQMLLDPCRWMALVAQGQSAEESLDFPGGPEVKTLCFHCRKHGFYPWLGNLDPTCFAVARPKKKKKKRKSHRTPVRRKPPEVRDGCAEMGKSDLRAFGGTPTVSTLLTVQHPRDICSQ